MRRAAAAPAACVALAGMACGDTDGAKRIAVGDGARGAHVWVPAGGSEGRVGVVFLHGWGATHPETYGAWMRHLVRRGHVVIAPRYQDGRETPSDEVLGNAIAGVRAGLARAPGLSGLVAAGHSAGGALAADLAAVAPRSGLPRPRAVFAVYPGRGLRGVFAPMPDRDLGAIPDAVLVEAWASDDDPVVGTRTARSIARETGGRYRLVRDDAIDDHGAPADDGPAARRAFWARLDELVARIRAARRAVAGSAAGTPSR